MRFTLNKKGYQIKDIAPIAISLGLAIVALVIMTSVTTNMADDECASGYTYNDATSRCVNSTGQWVGGAGETYMTNISYEGLSGMGELGSWFDTIGLVVAAAVIISLLVYAFAFKK